MDQKRIEILERASQVFMRYGIKSVTMDDLSRELGVSKKTIYKYFDDKNGLVRSMIEMKLEMDRQMCDMCEVASENAIDSLIQISRLVIEHISGINPAVFYDMKKYHPEAWKLTEEHKWDFILTNIRQNIDQGIKEGLYRDNMNSEIIARMYVASTEIIMNGEVFQWPEFKLENIFREFVRFQIKGMASDKGIKYLKEKFNHEINE